MTISTVEMFLSMEWKTGICGYLSLLSVFMHVSYCEHLVVSFSGFWYFRIHIFHTAWPLNTSRQLHLVSNLKKCQSVSTLPEKQAVLNLLRHHMLFSKMIHKNNYALTLWVIKEISHGNSDCKGIH